MGWRHEITRNKGDILTSHRIRRRKMDVMDVTGDTEGLRPLGQTNVVIHHQRAKRSLRNGCVPYPSLSLTKTTGRRCRKRDMSASHRRQREERKFGPGSVCGPRRIFGFGWQRFGSNRKSTKKTSLIKSGPAIGRDRSWCLESTVNTGRAALKCMHQMWFHEEVSVPRLGGMTNGASLKSRVGTMADIRGLGDLWLRSPLTEYVVFESIERSNESPSFRRFIQTYTRPSTRHFIQPPGLGLFVKEGQEGSSRIPPAGLC